MVVLHNYITYREEDGEGVLRYYVLQKQFPHYVGVILEAPKHGTWQSPIAGYNLWVCYAGTIRGNMIPSYKSVSQETQSVYDDMAQWYLVNRILKQPERYKKFKINV